MEQSYKESFTECAKIVPNYTTIPVMDICESYLSTDDDYLKSAYVSVLILRYWSKINTYYYKSLSLHIEDVDALYWVMESIVKVLNAHVWKDPNSTLFNDPDAFEKAFNVRLSCARYTDYQASNRLKRQNGHNVLSLNQIQEGFNDLFVVKDDASVLSFRDIEAYELVKFFFSRKDYFKSFLIDGIISYGMVSDRLLKQFFSSLGDYSMEFSLRYGIPIEKVTKALGYVHISSDKFKYKLEFHRKELRRYLLNQ